MWWAITALLVTAFGAFAPSAAQAATEGPGMRIGGVFVGAFITSTNGSNAFCIEPDGDNPTAEVPATQMSVLRGYRMQSNGHWVERYTNERGLRMINFITSQYGAIGSGQEWQNTQGAAVALAIWTIRGWHDSVVAEWVAGVSAQAPAEVQALADQFLLEAADRAVPAVLTPPEEPVVTWSAQLQGRVAIPAGYTQFSIESGGRLVGPAPDGVDYSSSNTVAGLDPARAHTLAFEALPTESSSRLHSVEMNASWVQHATEWPAKLWGFQPGIDDADQLLVAGGGPEELTDSGSWEFFAKPETSGAFAPVVTTQVVDIQLQQGEDYVDQVTFGMAEGSAEWPRYWKDGVWHNRTVRATGVLYGPFLDRPERTAQVPTDRELPIAGSAVVDAVDGAGTYEARVSAPISAGHGFYTWVWRIDGHEQGPQIQTGDEADWHVSPDYMFQDAFGILEETHVRPMVFNIETKLRDRELPPGGSTTDTIAVDPGSGGWIQQDGAPVPVTFLATVYEVDERPVRASEAPDGARVRATERVTAHGPGESLSIPVDVPLELSGGVTVQVCLRAEDQEAHVRDLIVEGCDDWGIPEESAQIVLPKVSTLAQADGIVGRGIHDVATVTGLVPEHSSLGFTAYLLPEEGAIKYDEHWNPVLDGRGEPERWTAAALSSMDADETCIAQPVAYTPRIAVGGPGAYRSPEVIARSAGTVHWVEDLAIVSTDEGAAMELHRGVCGLPDETTRVRADDVPLPTTGGAPGEVLGAAALVLAGAGALLLLRRRRIGRRHTPVAWEEANCNGAMVKK